MTKACFGERSFDAGAPCSEELANARPTTPPGGASRESVFTWGGTVSLPLLPLIETTNPPGIKFSPGSSFNARLNAPAGSESRSETSFCPPARSSCTSTWAVFAIFPWSISFPVPTLAFHRTEKAAESS